FDAGITRAHGQGRRGRTIREDATVAGLMRRIERHFGLDRYGFEVRIVHAGSGRRVPAADLLRKYRVEAEQTLGRSEVMVAVRTWRIFGSSHDRNKSHGSPNASGLMSTREEEVARAAEAPLPAGPIKW